MHKGLISFLRIKGNGVMSEKDDKEFYIVPWDVTQLYGAEDALVQKGISAKDLQEFSKNIVAQKQLFIMDACQSAGALDAVAMRGAAEEKAIAQLARSTGSHWLMASGSDQFAHRMETIHAILSEYCSPISEAQAKARLLSAAKSAQYTVFSNRETQPNAKGSNPIHPPSYQRPYPT